MASANLFQSYLQPPKSVMDYMGELDARDMRRTQLEGAQQHNAIQALTLRQQTASGEQALGERNALQRIASGWTANTSPEERIAALRNSGMPGLMTQADALEKQHLERQKTEAQVGETKAKTTKEQGAAVDDALKRYRSGLDFIDTPQGAARWMQAQYEDPLTGAHLQRLGPIDQLIARIPQDPAGFQQWRQQAALGMDKFMDNQRQAATQAETARHNKAGEKNATDTLAVSRDRLEHDKQQAKGTYDPERGVLVDTRTGEARPVMQDGQPIGAKKPSEGQQKVTDAKEAIALLDQAEPLLKSSTGSFSGKAIDMVAQAFSVSTPGSISAQKLKAIEGALVAKMPKMSGPQSDKDVLLYRQMAGLIGDDTVPYARKAAAMQTVREIQERYAGLPKGSTKPTAPGAPAAPSTAANGASVSNW